MGTDDVSRVRAAGVSGTLAVGMSVCGEARRIGEAALRLPMEYQARLMTLAILTGRECGELDAAFREWLGTKTCSAIRGLDVALDLVRIGGDCPF